MTNVLYITDICSTVMLSVDHVSFGWLIIAAVSCRIWSH